MTVVLPGGKDGNNHDGPMDVGIGVEYLSSYHCIKDGDGGGGSNGIVPSLYGLGRGKLCGCQRGGNVINDNHSLDIESE